MNDIVNSFKESEYGNKKAKIVAKNFDNYYDYKLALTTSFLN